MVPGWISVLRSLFSIVNNTMSQTGYIIKKKGSFWLMVPIQGGDREFERDLAKLVFMANTL